MTHFIVKIPELKVSVSTIFYFMFITFLFTKMHASCGPAQQDYYKIDYYILRLKIQSIV